MKTIRVFLVDDHEVILDSLAMMMSSLPGIEVAGKATNGQAALEKIDALDVDIVLSDMHMPTMTGHELAAQLRMQHPEIRVILLTMEEEPEVIQAAVQMGICGYVLKRASIDELETAIRTVADGERYYMVDINSPETESDGNLQPDGSTPVHQLLSKREIQIIRLIVNDVPNSEIAEQLYISTTTVETHRRNIFRKLNIHSAVALTRLAIKHKLI